MVPLTTVVGAPKLLDALPPETLLSDETINLPRLIEVLPVYVFAPASVHVPVPAFVNAVVFAMLLSTMAPSISPVPAVEPWTVSVLAPAPVAVRLLVNFNRPVPDWSTTPPPVVPARLSTLLLVSPAPVYFNV